MKNLRALPIARQLIRLLAVAVFVCAPAETLRGQSVSQPMPSGRETVERDLAEREWLLRNIGKATRKDIEVKPQRFTLAQVKKDYEGLQQSNNQILGMLAKGPFSYDVIALASADIRKRAARLKAALQLSSQPKTEKREKVQDELDPKSLKPSLLALDALIWQVVTNPIFKDAGRVVDVENSMRAGTDLEEIMELSAKIKRSAEKMGKGAP